MSLILFNQKRIDIFLKSLRSRVSLGEVVDDRDEDLGVISLDIER